MKKEWWILIIIIVVPNILMIGIGNLNYLTETRTRKQIYLDNVKNLAFHNAINNIYREKMDHNVLIIKGKRNNEKYKVYSNWEHKFLIGDSISKDSGSLKLEHYRDGKLLEILDYNDIYIREGW